MTKELDAIGTLLERISDNTVRVSEYNTGLLEITGSSAGNQTFYSILKMLGVVIVAFVQVYLIIGKFDKAQSKRR